MSLDATARPRRRGVALRVRAVGVTLVLGILSAMGAATPARGLSACDGRSVEGEWTVIAAPAFSVGPAEILASDLAWSDERIVLVTNGYEVLGSTDGGCTWTPRWRSDVAAAADVTAVAGRADAGRVVDLLASPDGDADRITLLIHDVSTTVASSARILTTRDGGATWRSPTVPPAPPTDSAFGRGCAPHAACRLEGAPGDPDALLLTSAPGPIAPGALWRSDDGGDTWEAVAHSVGTGDTFESVYRGIAPAVMSPGDSQLVHATFGCRVPQRSEDGGRTWTLLEVPLQGNAYPVGIAVAQPAGAPPSVAVVQHADYCVGSTIDAVHLTHDGGATWTTSDLIAEDIDGVALDRSGRVATVTDETGAAWLVRAGGAVAALSPPGDRAIHAPSATGGRDGALTYVSDDAILLLSVAVDAPPTSRARVIPDIPDLGTCATAPATAPAPEPPAVAVQDELVLPSGGTGRLDVRFAVPPRHVPVDVFGVLDASGSMQDAIDSLSRSVVEVSDGLADQRIDLALGLAEFRSRNTVAYRRLLEVGPVDCRAERALATIEPDGNDETHLIALHQALTGRGLPQLGVPADRGAGFREDALRIVLHATDEEVTEGEPFDPAFDEVVSAFAAARAEHVGIRVEPTVPVDTGQPEVDPTHASLDRIGRAVGTVAPARGIDCNGDGLTDVTAGEPVTCVFGTAVDALSETSLGDVLAQVVRGLVQPVSAEVAVAGDGPLAVEVGVAAGSFDRRDGTDLGGVIEVRCPAEPVEVDLPIRGLVDGVVVATGSTTVRCGAPVLAAPPPSGAASVPTPATTDPPAALAAPPAAPPPPPAPIAGAAPAASSASASASSSASANASATSAAATPTVVGMLADDPQTATERSFAASRRQPSPIVPIGAAGLLAATTWGLHVQTRTRHQERRS